VGGGEGRRRGARDAGRGTRGGWEFWEFGRFMVMILASLSAIDYSLFQYQEPSISSIGIIPRERGDVK